MRLVLDSNIALSGLVWTGTPSRLIDAALAGRVELVSSAALLAELQGVLQRDKFARALLRRGVAVETLFGGYAALVQLVTPAAIAATVLRDPADDVVLATALAAQADLVVPGDAHLLDLKRFMGIEIVNAATALAHVG